MESVDSADGVGDHPSTFCSSGGVSLGRLLSISKNFSFDIFLGMFNILNVKPGFAGAAGGRQVGGCLSRLSFDVFARRSYRSPGSLFYLAFGV